MAVLESEISWEGREAGENFPVALRILPRHHREHLHAVYGFARHVDELGDAFPGDRVAALHRFREQTRRIWTGERPDSEVLRRLARTVADCDLSEQPFLDLIAANLQDQSVTRYATFADLVGYCRLSADPVGRVVLEIFDAATPERVAFSDRICTALQIVEHLQDVAEDRRAGRTYLPQQSLTAYAVDDADLDADSASPALRALVRAETGRAEELLLHGSALVGTLRGWARLAVAGFVGGGLAVVDALRRVDGDVLAHHATPTRADVARHAVAVLGRGRA